MRQSTRSVGVRSEAAAARLEEAYLAMAAGGLARDRARFTAAPKAQAQRLSVIADELHVRIVHASVRV